MLDPSKVPPTLRHFIHLAQWFGKADDAERLKVLQASSPKMLEQLKAVVTENEDALDEWLSGPEARASRLSDEYVAFSAMRMARDAI